MATLDPPLDAAIKVEGLYEPQRTDVEWFAAKPNLHWPARQLLEQYSGIHPREMMTELTKLVRQPSSNLNPHTCLLDR